jgi:hypothetical protein
MTMATKDQLPFTGAGTTKAAGAVSGGASGAHDFTQDPKDGAPKTGGGMVAESRPQQMGKDECNKESVIDGGKIPFPETEFKDAGIKGCGSIGNSSKPFKVKG